MSLDGVTRIAGDLEKKTITVNFEANEIAPEELVRQIEKKSYLDLTRFI